MSETPSRDPSRDNAMSVAAISSERTESDDNAWTRRLVFFLRIMAVVSVAKGLYHWAQVTGFVGGEEEAFENQPMAWQTATVYFAVIELVAAVGLWLATPWGAVVWLTTVVSMAVDRADVSGNLWRQPDGGGFRSRDARGLSGAGMDGGARAAAIATPNSDRGRNIHRFKKNPRAIHAGCGRPGPRCCRARENSHQNFPQVSR